MINKKTAFNHSTFLIVFIFAGLACVAFCSWAQEQLTITTYYPSPYGVYSKLRLFPQPVDPVGTPCSLALNSGEMQYYNGLVYFCNGTAWTPVGGTNWWKENPVNSGNIYNTNSGTVSVMGNLGINTTTPVSPLDIEGVNAGGAPVWLKATLDPAFDVSSSTTVPFGFLIDNTTITPYGVSANHVNPLATTLTTFLNIRGVGIGLYGNVAPQNSLDVGIATSNGGAAFGSYGGVNLAPDGGIIVSGDVGVGTPAPAGKLHVSHAAGADDLVVDQNTGNVGIGTKTPQYLLDVYSNQSPNKQAFRVRMGSDAETITFSTQQGMDNEIRSPYNLWLESENGAGPDIRISGPTYGANDIELTAPTVEVSGNLVVGGTITGTVVPPASDVRFKKDIKSIDGALEKVMKLRGVTYKWRKDEFPAKKFDDKVNMGLIAQEVEPVVPEVVSTDAKGYKALDYARLTALLIEAVKEQQGLIEKNKLDTDKNIGQLKSENESLKKRIEALENKIAGK